MKKEYSKIDIEIIFFLVDDVIKTSKDNVGVMPEFPEDF